VLIAKRYLNGFAFAGYLEQKSQIVGKNNHLTMLSFLR